MSHVKESCHISISHDTYRWVMSHIAATRQQTPPRPAMSHIRLSHVTHTNESYEIWVSHVTHTNKSYHISVSHVTHIAATRHQTPPLLLASHTPMSHVTCKRVMSHIHMSHVTYRWVMSHIDKACHTNSSHTASNASTSVKVTHTSESRTISAACLAWYHIL